MLKLVSNLSTVIVLTDKAQEILRPFIKEDKITTVFEIFSKLLENAYYKGKISILKDK